MIDLEVGDLVLCDGCELGLIVGIENPQKRLPTFYCVWSSLSIQWISGDDITVVNSCK